MLRDALETAAAIGLIRPATFTAALRAGLIPYERSKRCTAETRVVAYPLPSLSINYAWRSPAHAG